MSVRPCTALLATLSLVVAPAGLTQLSGLAPEGWKYFPPVNDYGGATFSSPDGISEAGVNHFSQNSNVQELARAAVSMSRPNGADTIKSQDLTSMQSTGALLGGGLYRSDDKPVTGFGLAVANASGGTMTCWIRFPEVGVVPPFAATFLEACVGAAKRGEVVYESDRRTLAARRQIASIPFAPGRGRAVEAVVLEIYYRSGVGGMVLPDYRTVVLFKDGAACKCLRQPVEDIDVSELINSEPDHVARWVRKDDAYVLTWPDASEPIKIELTGERPLPYSVDQRLDGYWQRLSGGGNTAMGGDVNVSIANGYRFWPDGTFDTSNAASATAPGVVAGSTGGRAGRYRISGSTLTLTVDGKSLRTSIYHSGGPKPVLWIGGDSFTQ